MTRLRRWDWHSPRVRLIAVVLLAFIPIAILPGYLLATDSTIASLDPDQVGPRLRELIAFALLALAIVVGALVGALLASRSAPDPSSTASSTPATGRSWWSRSRSGAA